MKKETKKNKEVATFIMLLDSISSCMESALEEASDLADQDLFREVLKSAGTLYLTLDQLLRNYNMEYAMEVNSNAESDYA